MASAIVQWYTAVSVTKPMTVSETHFQKTTSSLFKCDFTFCFVSILKIWRVLFAIESKSVNLSFGDRQDLPFSAKISSGG